MRYATCTARGSVRTTPVSTLPGCTDRHRTDASGSPEAAKRRSSSLASVTPASLLEVYAPVAVYLREPARRAWASAGVQASSAHPRACVVGVVQIQRAHHVHDAGHENNARRRRARRSRGGSLTPQRRQHQQGQQRGRLRRSTCEKDDDDKCTKQALAPGSLFPNAPRARGRRGPARRSPCRRCRRCSPARPAAVRRRACPRRRQRREHCRATTGPAPTPRATAAAHPQQLPQPAATLQAPRRGRANGTPARLRRRSEPAAHRLQPRRMTHRARLCVPKRRQSPSQCRCSSDAWRGGARKASGAANAARGSRGACCAARRRRPAQPLGAPGRPGDNESAASHVVAQIFGAQAAQVTNVPTLQKRACAERAARRVGAARQPTRAAMLVNVPSRRPATA